MGGPGTGCRDSNQYNAKPLYQNVPGPGVGLSLEEVVSLGSKGNIKLVEVELPMVGVGLHMEGIGLHMEGMKLHMVRVGLLMVGWGSIWKKPRAI